MPDLITRLFGSNDSFINRSINLQVLHCFEKVLNIVQATVNQSHTLLGYVIKQKAQSLEKPAENSAESSEIGREKDSTENPTENRSCGNGPACEVEAYSPWIVEVISRKVHNLEIERTKQIRVQFLYKQREQKNGDRFLVLIHQECKDVAKV